MVRHEGCQSTYSVFLKTLHNLISPYIVQPGMLLEVCATCVLLEVVNLATITQIAQSGPPRRLAMYIFLNTLYNFAFYST